jgi:hypothetical protein
MNTKPITTKRKNYWRTDLIRGDRVIGFLISRPKGFRLTSTDPDLRWFHRRYFKSPDDLMSGLYRGINNGKP